MTELRGGLAPQLWRRGARDAAKRNSTPQAPENAPRPPLPRWATLLLGLTICVAGLVGLALVFDSAATYEDIARANEFERIPFHVPGTVGADRRQVVRYDVAARVALHDRTLRFVLGQDSGTTRDPATRDPLFSLDEQRHLADVRDVFARARAAAIVALAIAVILLVAAALRGALVLTRTIRDAAVIAAALVGVVGAAAAFAFEPAFLLFHEVFFPQGNFSFDPATSNLLSLYPEAYWYAVTLRVGLAFLLVAAGIAAAGHVASRRLAR